MKDRFLINTNIPRWFTLSADPKKGFPIVVIYNDVLDQIKQPRDYVVEDARKKFKFSEEEFPFFEIDSGFYGFGKGIQQVDSNEETTTFRLNLPVVIRHVRKPCPDCKGEKQNEFGTSCSHCSGSGLMTIHSWKPSYALAFSVQLLLLQLQWEPKRKVELKEKQLLSVGLVTDKSPLNGGSVYSTFSPALIDFLRKQNLDTKFPNLVDPMIRTHFHMWRKFGRKTAMDTHGFNAYQPLPGNLILGVPGNACDLCQSPYVQEIEEGMGAEFTPHNMDSQIQQFSILTGLAALCDWFEEE
jgi:hypothetical protein